MWLKDEAARLTADRAYLQDYSGWVSSIHWREAKVLVAAIRQTDDRDQRKALSTRLVQTRMTALLSIGLLFVAIRRRLASSLVEERLKATVSDARGLLREAGRQQGQAFWQLLDLPSPEQVRVASDDPAVANEYLDLSEERGRNLERIADLARQDMLLTVLDPSRHGRILVATPLTVSAIKTGRISELPEMSNTAFYLADLSGGQLDDTGDIVALACPTTPAVVEEIADDIAFIDQEAGETAALVDLTAGVGLLRTALETSEAPG